MEKENIGVEEKTLITNQRVCLVCGETRYIERSHILSRSNDGPNKKHNLIDLCPSHHRYFDNMLLNDKEQAVIDRELMERFWDIHYGWACEDFKCEGVKACEDCDYKMNKPPYCSILASRINREDSERVKC